MEDWENASAVARVFNIGRAEAGAVSALQSKIHPEVTRMLKAAVAMRGMRTFITHDLRALQVGRVQLKRGLKSSPMATANSWCHGCREVVCIRLV